jgi:hypothetical protein
VFLVTLSRLSELDMVSPSAAPFLPNELFKETAYTAIAKESGQS